METYRKINTSVKWTIEPQQQTKERRKDEKKTRDVWDMNLYSISISWVNSQPVAYINSNKGMDGDNIKK